MESPKVKAERVTVWSALTRRRPSQLIDLFLGLLLVLAVAAWLSSISKAAGFAAFVLVTIVYLVRTARRDRRRAEVDATPSLAGSRFEAVETLNDLLAHAPPIPLTDSVRIDPRRASLLAESIREAAAGSDAADEADELAQLILDARPVPLTSETRVDIREARRHLAAIRVVAEASG